jgi:hypothetical protein
MMRVETENEEEMATQKEEGKKGKNTRKML